MQFLNKIQASIYFLSCSVWFRTDSFSLNTFLNLHNLGSVDGYCETGKNSNTLD